MSWSYNDYWDYGWRYNYLTLAARTNWHWGFDASLIDFYTGISLGYRVFWDSWYGSDYYHYAYTASYGGFYYGAQVGVHFYFTKVFGAMIETGYPYLLKTGLSLKFGGGAEGYVVDADSLNVRSGPSSDTAIVGQLTRNTRVEVLDKSGSWWKVKAGRIEGYVSSSFLKRG